MELNIQTAELALREAAESNPGAWCLSYNRTKLDETQ